MRLRLLLVCVLLALVSAPLAEADRVYHSEHMDLMRVVGTDPLHKGFVRPKREGPLVERKWKSDVAS